MQDSGDLLREAADDVTAKRMAVDEQAKDDLAQSTAPWKTVRLRNRGPSGEYCESAGDDEETEPHCRASV